MIRRPNPRAAAVLAVAVAACTARDTVATSGAGTDDLAAFCEGQGPPTLADGTCSGELAETLFRHAVCGCGSLSFGGDLTTDGFDSRVAPYVANGVGGHVASNVGLDGSQSMTVRGDVTVGGSEGIEAGDLLDVLGELSSGGPLGRSSSAILVGGGAQIAGDVTVDSIDVGGALITPEGVDVSGTVRAMTRETADVNVPPPCRCDDAVDVEAVIAEHAVVNHDAEIDLDARDLTGIDGDTELDLPCGRFYLDEIQGQTAGNVTIRAGGRTALFVGGNITLQQDLVIELAAGAELDLFVAGNIQVAGVSTLGDPERPRSLRLYVASGGSIALSAGSLLAGNLYAPLSDLASSAPIEVFGALVVNRVNGAASVTVHHDRAIADAADDCVD